MARHNNKAKPVPPGYVRRTGPTSCQVMPVAGMHIEELRLLRRAGLLYAGVIPFGVNVSLDLWAMFIEKNHERSKQDEDYIKDGAYLPPDDAAAFLYATATNYPDTKGRGPHAITI